jgi:hypothetical protein
VLGHRDDQRGCGFLTQDETGQDIQAGTQFVSISIDNKPLFDDELAQYPIQGTMQEDQSIQNRVLCEAWMEIGQDPICGAEKNGGTFGRRFSTTSMSTSTWLTTRLRVIAIKLIHKKVVVHSRTNAPNSTWRMKS